MTRIWYDEQTGAIVSTAKADGRSLPENGTFIDVEDFTGHPMEWKVENGALVPSEGMLGNRKTGALTYVRLACVEVRALFVTDLPGQEMVYLEKAQEARAFQADPTGSYPLLEAEIGITGADTAEVASVVSTLADQWKQIAASLETIRLGANSAIASAISVAEIDTAIATFRSDLDTLKGSL